MIDKELKNAPVFRVPKTDLIRVAVRSPDWSAAIKRRLIAPHPARVLESLLSIEALQQANSQANTANQQRRRWGIGGSMSLSRRKLIEAHARFVARDRHRLRRTAATRAKMFWRGSNFQIVHRIEGDRSHGNTLF